MTKKKVLRVFTPPKKLFRDLKILHGIAFCNSGLELNFEELLLSVIVHKVNKLENLFNKCMYERSRARIPIFISVVVVEFIPPSQLFYTVASSLMTNCTDCPCGSWSLQRNQGAAGKTSAESISFLPSPL